MAEQDDTDDRVDTQAREPEMDDSAVDETVPSDEPGDITDQPDAPSEDVVRTDDGSAEAPPVDESASDADGATTSADGTATPGAAIRANSVRAAGLISGLGVLIFWSPILLTGYGMSMLLNIVLGVTIAVVGALTALKAGEDAISAVGLPALIALLALVIVGSAFLWDLSSDLLVWSNVVVGGLVVLLSVLTIVGFRKAQAAEARESTPSA